MLLTHHAELCLTLAIRGYVSCTSFSYVLLRLTYYPVNLLAAPLANTAGFTGTRCGYTVVPEELVREGVSLRKMWLRRQTTKFNGVSYPVQEPRRRCSRRREWNSAGKISEYIQENAQCMAATLEELGIWFIGGKNSPYIWMKCPEGMTSWGFFDFLLEKAEIVGTPGSGFGFNGKGSFRLTAFNTEREKTQEAMERLKAFLGKE